MEARTNIGSAIKRQVGFRQMARIRSELNKLTRGRVGLYSTAEHYSDGPAAKILRYYQYDPAEEISCAACGWNGAASEGSQQMFDVPQLGLRDASAGEICLAARAFLGDEPTLNKCYFDQAVAAGGAGDHSIAAGAWQLCLESGDPMAHYGLGYTLYELGDFRGAYRHLRAYTEITPNNAWAWCWLGRACLRLGELDEARHALETAIELEDQGAQETDAPELLEELEGRNARRG